jgi:hypothetical protein
VYALIPFLGSIQNKGKTNDDKTIERLFGVYDFVLAKMDNTEFKETDLFETENWDMFNILDADISPKSKSSFNHY